MTGMAMFGGAPRSAGNGAAELRVDSGRTEGWSGKCRDEFECDDEFRAHDHNEW